jgi:hypothetical protein
MSTVATNPNQQLTSEDGNTIVYPNQPAGGDGFDDINLEDLSEADLAAYFGGVDIEPQPQPQPAAAGGDPRQASGDAEFHKQRLRPKNDKDQQVIDLYKSESFHGSFQDAVNMIYGSPKGTAESPGGQAPGTAPNTSSGSEQAITTIQTEIAALENEVNAAAEAGNTTEALRLQQQITRKHFALRDAQEAQRNEVRRAEEQEYEQFQQQAAASWHSAVKQSPDLANQASEQRVAFDAFRREKEADPAYGPIFGSPKWPEILVREFLASQPAVARPPAATRPSPNRQTKVLTTGGPTNSGPVRQTPGRITPDVLMNNLDKLGTEALRGLLAR